METNKEEPATFLDRASRATRGKRMNRLLDEEAEEDDLFWNQDALKEDENDDEYEEEGEAADEFDSDFDDDEPEADEEAEKEVDERSRPKKRLIAPGKPTMKKKKDLSKLKKGLKTEHPPEPSTSNQQTEIFDDAEGEKTIRKSTRTSVIVRQAERDAIRAALQATMKPIKRKKEGEEKKMSQEEMLLEAAKTEIINLRNLERVLAREEEVKKRAVLHKDVYTGPLIRYASKDGYSCLKFCHGASFDSKISVEAAPYPQKPVCAITGLPARYRDPKTGLPYATKEAFKIIRERYSAEAKSGGSRDMGSLAASISGQGFLKRRKRIEVSNKCSRARDVSYFARFRVKSAADGQISD